MSHRPVVTGVIWGWTMSTNKFTMCTTDTEVFSRSHHVHMVGEEVAVCVLVIEVLSRSHHVHMVGEKLAVCVLVIEVLSRSHHVHMVGEKVAVCVLVIKWLFPHVKFICNLQVELMYIDDVKLICRVVRVECALREYVSNKKWWENACRWVSRQITILPVHSKRPHN
jgi:hypothetical protein